MSSKCDLYIVFKIYYLIFPIINYISIVIFFL